MIKFSILSLYLLIIIFNFSFSKFLSRSLFSIKDSKYIHLGANDLKEALNNKEFFVIDTRDMPIIAKGYIQNTLLIPTSLFAWLSSVVPYEANIIIITDETNYLSVINKLKKLGNYKIYGYCFYDELIKSSLFNIQTIQYDPNNKESIQNIINNKRNTIIDIREMDEYIETGVIEGAKLVPLSTFLYDNSDIPKEGNVYVFCKSGLRAIIGMSFIKRSGYKNNFIIMKGGMKKAIDEKYPLIPYSEN